MFCLVSALVLYYPESRYVEVHLCLFFPLCVFILYSFSHHFVYFPTTIYELNLDSTLNRTDVCLPIYSRPCANMCEYNQHVEKSSDDFVSPLPARYIAIVYQVIS